MKHLKNTFLFLLLTAFSFSYSQNQTTKNTAKLVGNWNYVFEETIGAYNENTVEDKNNVFIGARFHFLENNTLEVVYSDESKFLYNWKLNNKKLVIYDSNNKDLKDKVADKYKLQFYNNEILMLRKKPSNKGFILKNKS